MAECRTDPQLPGDLLSGRARGLVAKPREYVNGWATESITSTAQDMAGYVKMLASHGRGSAGRVLEPASLRAMWTRQTTLPLDRWTCCSGLGWTRTLPQLDWAGPVVYKGGDPVRPFDGDGPAALGSRRRCVDQHIQLGGARAGGRQGSAAGLHGQDRTARTR
jgi:CubicO group peptidase (beta-lactamase class C family)